MTTPAETDSRPKSNDDDGAPTLDDASMTSVASDYLDYDLDGSCYRTVPRGGRCVIIRAAGTDRVLTLQNNKVTLAPPGLRGTFVWDCVETDGWLGFRNPATAKFLGHAGGDAVMCAGESHKGWEQFMAPSAADGNVYLVSSFWGKLCRLGTRVEDGQEVLVRLPSGDGGDGGAEGIAWEFFEFDR